MMGRSFHVVTQPHCANHDRGVDRRRFDNLVIELSVAAGRLVPRYALWLHLHELGLDPVGLPKRDLLAFLDDELRGFMSVHDLEISDRALRRLRSRIDRFDPRYPTPEETMRRILDLPS
jgi:hypothetical protein